MGIKTTVPAAALAVGLFITSPGSIAIDALTGTVASLFGVAIGNLDLVSAANGQPVAPADKHSDALSAYNNARNEFELILGQRRALITRINGCRTCRDKRSTLRAST
jgi:hypothetical protein